MDTTMPLLEWVADRAGSAVVAHQRLLGGISSLILSCRLADERQVVVRQIENREWLEREPTIIAQEATALRLLEQSPLVTPRLIACDIDAGRLCMSQLPGVMRFTCDDLSTDRIRAMAAAAVTIAATPLLEPHGLPVFTPWVAAEIEPPAWGDPGLWTSAIDLYHLRLAELRIDQVGWMLGSRPVLLHRDLHPLNMLWPHDGTDAKLMPSLVDWLNACVGHPHAELGHCRWNLAVLSGLQAADGFLAHYLELTADEDLATYDPLWDLVALLSIGGDRDAISGTGWRSVGRTDLTPSVVTESSEQLLRSIME